MSWERTENELIFICDAPTCDAEAVFPLPPGTDTTQHFLAASATLRTERAWLSTKAVGRPWEHWCQRCQNYAETRKRELEERERERARRANEPYRGE